MVRDWKAVGYAGIKIFCGTVVFISVVFTFYTLGPRLETRFWPVVGKLQILAIEPTPDGFTKIKAGFSKLRDCEYLGLAWFVGDRPTSFERVAVSVMRSAGDTGSPNRPLGFQKAGPWIISVTPDELQRSSFAQLSHRCHPFWTTITEFYP